MPPPESSVEWHIDPKGVVHYPHFNDDKKTRCRRNPNVGWKRSRRSWFTLSCGACIYLLRRDKKGHNDP